MARTSAYFGINCRKMSPETMDFGFLILFSLAEIWCIAGQIEFGESTTLGDGRSGSYSELIRLKNRATFSATVSSVSPGNMSLIHQLEPLPSPWESLFTALQKPALFPEVLTSILTFSKKAIFASSVFFFTQFVQCFPSRTSSFPGVLSLFSS